MVGETAGQLVGKMVCKMDVLSVDLMEIEKAEQMAALTAFEMAVPMDVVRAERSAALTGASRAEKKAVAMVVLMVDLLVFSMVDLLVVLMAV